MSAPLRKGRIVWVEIRDSQGQNPKRRPAVILTPTDEIQPGGAVQVAAITTLLGTSPAVAVPLPWHRDGHPRTKLRRPSEVVCNWVEDVPIAEIQVTEGLVPLKEMSQIDAILRRLGTPSANLPADPPPPDAPPA